MATRMESFSTLEAAQIAGLPPRTVDYWARTGFIAPSIADATGRGSERKYAFDDLVALRVARGLRNAGISMQALRFIVTGLRAKKGGVRNPLAESRLIAVGSDVDLVNSRDDVISVLRNPGKGAFAFIFDVAGNREEIKKKIKLLRVA
jgi:DNA-binding transcriptional MerR regulator